MKGLLVDDDPGLRRSVRRLIEQEFQVDLIEAADGPQALDILLREDIAFVLLDLTMPSLSGLDTLRFIRRSPHLSKLPVVMMTGLPDESTVRAAMELGVIEFLAKPLLPTRFRERVAPIIATVLAAGQASTDSALALEPDHRAVFVDCSPECRAAAKQVLSRLCHVEVADNEFAAWKQCLVRAPDVLFIGFTSDLLSRDELVKELRKHHELLTMRVVAVVPSESVEATRASGVFNAVVTRSLSVEGFERGLWDYVTLDTRARLLVQPDSSWLKNELLDTVCDALTSVMQTQVTCRTDRLGRFPARWVTAGVELQCGSLAWAVRFVCPFDTALRIAGVARDSESDELTESDAVSAVASATRYLGHQIQVVAAKSGLTSKLTESTPHIQTTPAGLTRGGGATSWRFAALDYDVGTVSVVPLWPTAAQSASAKGAIATRYHRSVGSCAPQANDTATAYLSAELASVLGSLEAPAENATAAESHAHVEIPFAPKADWNPSAPNLVRWA